MKLSPWVLSSLLWIVAPALAWADGAPSSNCYGAVFWLIF